MTDFRMRHMPVLQAAVEAVEASGKTSVPALGATLGLSNDDVIRSLKALERQGLVVLEKRLSGVAAVANVTGAAYDRLDEWQRNDSGGGQANYYAFGDQTNFVMGNNYGSLHQGPNRGSPNIR